MDYLNNAKMRPFDTIIVYQTTGNKILSRSSLIAAVLQLLNLIYTINNVD